MVSSILWTDEAFDTLNAPSSRIAQAIIVRDRPFPAVLRVSASSCCGKENAYQLRVGCTPEVPC